MGNSSYKQTFVRLVNRETGELLVPEELRPKLADEATATDSNLTETAIRILCLRYKVPFTPTGRKTKPAQDGEELNLRLPYDLVHALEAAASARKRQNQLGKWTMQDEIKWALCAYFGLRLAPPARRRYRRRAARAVA